MPCWYWWGIVWYFNIYNNILIQSNSVIHSHFSEKARCNHGYICLYTQRNSLSFMFCHFSHPFSSAMLHSLFLNNSVPVVTAWNFLSFFACSKKIPYTRVLSISSRTPVMDAKLLSFEFVFLFLSTSVSCMDGVCLDFSQFIFCIVSSSLIWGVLKHSDGVECMGVVWQTSLSLLQNQWL